MTSSLAAAGGALVTVIAAALALEFLLPATAARAWIALIRRIAGLRTHRIKLADATLEYLEGGSGEPLLLIHGFGGDKDNFSLVAPFLTRYFRVIAPDLPGFGNASRDPAAGYRVADQVRRLHEFIARLNPGRVHLGGNSMGGFIAAQYAATYPDEVATLWLLDPAGTQVALQTSLMREFTTTGRIPLLVAEESAYAALLEVATHRPSFVPPSIGRILARRAVTDFGLHTSIFRQISEESPLLEPVLPSIRAPSLIVWGAEDRVLNPEAAADMAALIPASRLIVMAGVGHLPMVERPRRVARDFLAFQLECRNQSRQSKC